MGNFPFMGDNPKKNSRERGKNLKIKKIKIKIKINGNLIHFLFLTLK